MPVAIAGVGGLILGHILWLIGISAARAAPSSVSTWVLAVSVLFLVAAGVSVRRAWQRYRRGDRVWAAFLGGLAVSPVIFTVIVLGVTYL